MFHILAYSGPKYGPYRWNLYAAYDSAEGAENCFESCVSRNPELPWRLVRHAPETVREYQP